MKVAVMQPYFFPYLGYFNLLAACDAFISLDNVQYIQRGFLNRNQIAQGDNICTFTVPVARAPRNYWINQRTVAPEYERFKRKFLTQLQSAYSKAPFFEQTMQLVKRVLDSPNKNLARLCEATLFEVMAYTGLARSFYTASSLIEADTAANLNGGEKLIILVKKLAGTMYINPIGGYNLYTKKDFLQEGIELVFIKPQLPSYPRGKNQFIPALSIIDVLMHNSPGETLRLCQEYKIIN